MIVAMATMQTRYDVDLVVDGDQSPRSASRSAREGASRSTTGARRSYSPNLRGSEAIRVSRYAAAATTSRTFARSLAHCWTFHRQRHQGDTPPMATSLGASSARAPRTDASTWLRSAARNLDLDSGLHDPARCAILARSKHLQPRSILRQPQASSIRIPAIRPWCSCLFRFVSVRCADSFVESLSRSRSLLAAVHDRQGVLVARAADIPGSAAATLSLASRTADQLAATASQQAQL